MEEKELAAGAVIEHPKGSLRWNAQQLLMRGEDGSIKEVADRLDGKVAQAIVGDDEADPVRIETIRHIIVRPNEAGHSDSGSVPAATGTEPV